RGKFSGPGRIHRAGPGQSTSASGGDGLGVGTDLDLARLGLLRNRDVHGKHAVGVVGLDLVGVNRVRQADTTGVGTHHPLADERLLALGVLLVAGCANGQHAAVNSDVDALPVDAGQVEPELNLVLAPDRVHPGQ